MAVNVHKKSFNGQKKNNRENHGRIEAGIRMESSKEHKNTITSTSNYYEDIFKRPIICLPKKWQIL